MTNDNKDFKDNNKFKKEANTQNVKKRKKLKEPEPIEENRLNKYLSHNTKYSRREADELIKQGKVKVDDEVVIDLGTKVTYKNKVYLRDKLVYVDKHRKITVIVYNKQKGEIVSKNDPQGRRTIFDSLSSRFAYFTPIGRLDYASEGVLLLTDEVKVADKLMHGDLERIYKIKLDGFITPSIEKAMLEGLELEDATKGARSDSKITSMSFAPFIGYTIISSAKKYSKIKVAISEGKNRELRRFFAHFDLNVLDLKRLEFGGISLNNLPSGKSRYLSREEYRNLRDYTEVDKGYKQKNKHNKQDEEYEKKDL